MKMAKSLMLASAAGFVAVTCASAADLGVKKPSAVEYVKTCPQYGAGFFVVPGTTSCLKIIGRVRIDYVSGNVGTTQTTSGARTNDLDVFRARGYIGYDHRTATEYGMLRTYTRIMFTRDNAAPTVQRSNMPSSSSAASRLAAPPRGSSMASATPSMAARDGRITSMRIRSPIRMNSAAASRPPWRPKHPANAAASSVPPPSTPSTRTSLFRQRMRLVPVMLVRRCLNSSPSSSTRAPGAR